MNVRVIIEIDLDPISEIRVDLQEPLDAYGAKKPQEIAQKLADKALRMTKEALSTP